MNIKRVLAIFLRQIFLVKSNPVRLTAYFLWPVMNVILWGFISKYLGTFGQQAFSFTSVILGAIVFWDFMSNIQQRMMSGFLEDVWTKNFINYFASPLKIKEYVGGLVLTALASGSVAFLLTVSIAGLAFGYNVFAVGMYILPFLAILLIFGIAMGLFVTGLIFRLGPAAEWLGWPIPFIMSIFVGVFYPSSTLPSVMQIFSKLLPPTYVFDSMRSVLAGNLNIGGNFLIGLALAIAYLAITYIFFNRVYRRNLRSGAISRFGAEE